VHAFQVQLAWSLTAARLLGDFPVAEAEYFAQGVVAVQGFVAVDFTEILVFFKEFQKTQAVFPGPSIFHEFEYDDRPGYDRKSQQQQQHQFDHGGRVFDQIDKITIMIDRIN
jgi:hypothetical protein